VIHELDDELSVALYQLEGLRSDLSELQALLHVIQVSPVVQEDIHQLCHGVAAVVEASSSSLAVLSGRARAAERRRRAAGR